MGIKKNTTNGMRQKKQKLTAKKLKKIVKSVKKEKRNAVSVSEKKPEGKSAAPVRSRNKKATTARRPVLHMQENPDNRIVKAFEKVSYRNKTMLCEAIKTSNYKPVELAPAIHTLYRRNPEKALKAAEVFAATLPNRRDHSELFQDRKSVV